MASAGERRAPLTPPSKSAVLDAYMDLYVVWRERAAVLEVIYRRWALAGSAADRRTAFAGFCRALDEEERAARRFGEFASYVTEALAA